MWDDEWWMIVIMMKWLRIMIVDDVIWWLMIGWMENWMVWIAGENDWDCGDVKKMTTLWEMLMVVGDVFDVEIVLWLWFGWCVVGEWCGWNCDGDVFVWWFDGIDVNLILMIIVWLMMILRWLNIMECDGLNDGVVLCTEIKGGMNGRMVIVIMIVLNFCMTLMMVCVNVLVEVVCGIWWRNDDENWLKWMIWRDLWNVGMIGLWWMEIEWWLWICGMNWEFCLINFCVIYLKLKNPGEEEGEGRNLREWGYLEQKEEEGKEN